MIGAVFIGVYKREFFSDVVCVGPYFLGGSVGEQGTVDGRRFAEQDVDFSAIGAHPVVIFVRRIAERKIGVVDAMKIFRFAFVEECAGSGVVIGPIIIKVLF